MRGEIVYFTNYKALEKRVKALSIKYYNESLDFVKEDKLTQAIDLLRKSVAYDKSNVTAQNLLGLLYYRMGRITNAFIHWNTSASVKYDNNDAVKYLQDILNSVDFTEKSKAVSKFNESLEHARQGNYDMAVMRLKRGLDFNSKSVDILNLLAFCLIMQGSENEAYRYVERVLKIDKANPIALNYQKHLRPDRLTIFKAKDDNSGSYNKNAANAINKISSNRGNIIYFILGIVVTAIVCGALVVPAMFKKYEKTIGSYETDYNVLKNQTDTALTEKDEEISRLTQENEDMKSKLYTAGEQSLQERVKVLATIDSDYKGGQLDLASTKLIALDATGFTGEVLDQYRDLCSSVLPAAAEDYFSKGQAAQQDGKLDEAIEYYNNCIKCTQGGEEMRYSAMYQLAKIAIDQGDRVTAAKYYTTVAEKHPVESIKNEAATFLNEYYNS